MRRTIGTNKSGVLAGVLAVALIIAVPLGYFSNLVQLVGLDFASPYKAEVLRTAGVFIPPLGVVLGFISIDDTPNK